MKKIEIKEYNKLIEALKLSTSNLRKLLDEMPEEDLAFRGSYRLSQHILDRTD